MTLRSNGAARPIGSKVERSSPQAGEATVTAGSTDVSDVCGAEISDAEIDTSLTEQGAGVLSLADGGHANAVPISFGYRSH